MTNFRFLFLVFCPCGNDEILSFRNLSEKTETAPPSFPRRRESRSVGAETYRIKRFLQILRSGFPLSWE
ncbi:pilS cassette [Neisseria meningitidis]|uniref:PilS cassette n=1 Tax=Neisseria meningitidis TaxID=487 RepID=A0A425AJW8_NEIME|nr:pilS cassette [Neisseria meningitidis]MBG8631852.1 pilS cassette [Neisseria meningitidis]MCG8973110.1 pilS cassette [Neisseria meningitidis]PKT98597.1 pilS cassette [Neisseria meningitidis]PKU15531.1 pilS cassette [Neisseria meningitidis]